MKFLGTAGFLSVIVALALGCSATAGNNQFENTGGAGAGNGSGANGQGGDFNPAGTGGFNPTGGGGNSGNGCSVESQYVYVLSDANELYSFDPPSKTIKKIGTLGCNTTMSPNSMAIDRNATAWVNYVQGDLFGDSGGALYKVSTKDASCEASPTITLPAQWYRLGMGFSTDGAGLTTESLFVTGTGTIGAGDSPGLGQIDMQSKQVKPIANFSPSKYTGQSAELTGTGDSRLFGYFTTSPVYVGEINKTSGAITNEKAINGLNTPSAWAFSFWGGSFYLYAADAGNSSVTKYNPADGSVTTYMPDVGFRIVGAGVSTCAPVEPPK